MWPGLEIPETWNLIQFPGSVNSVPGITLSRNQSRTNLVTLSLLLSAATTAVKWVRMTTAHRPPCSSELWLQTWSCAGPMLKCCCRGGNSWWEGDLRTPLWICGVPIDSDLAVAVAWIGLHNYITSHTEVQMQCVITPSILKSAKSVGQVIIAMLSLPAAAAVNWSLPTSPTRVTTTDAVARRGSFFIGNRQQLYHVIPAFVSLHALRIMQTSPISPVDISTTLPISCRHAAVTLHVPRMLSSVPSDWCSANTWSHRR